MEIWRAGRSNFCILILSKTPANKNYEICNKVTVKFLLFFKSVFCCFSPLKSDEIYKIIRPNFGLIRDKFGDPKKQTEPNQKSKGYGTGYSQAVTHPSTNPACSCLTSEIERDRVHSTEYGRIRR